MISFSELNINSAIVDALNELNINEPSPIQEKAIPLLLEGHDVIGQAQTGTGKTFAYAIPLLENINENSNNVEALVLSPTRELSIQVANEIAKLTSKMKKIRLATIYGGESYEKQFRELNKRPQIIVGTPGRIIDMIERKKLRFDNIKYLVLDEADEMLKMGFQEDLETILKGMPKDRQTALFSATMPPFIKNVSKNYMSNPEMVKIENKHLTVDRITQQVYYCKKDQKKDLLVRLIDFYNFKTIMIFSNTKSMVDELVLFLQEQGYKADGLHGDLKQTSRDRVMQSFRSNNVDILIATDVAARGIDIDGIEAVINFDIPNENEIYVHRIGRTARAGASGMAITLATTRSKGRIMDLEKYTKQPITKMPIPDAKEIENARQKKLFLTLTLGIEANKDNHEYDALLTKLSHISSDPMPLFVTLIKMIDTNKKQYAEIDDVFAKKMRPSGVKTNYKEKNNPKAYSIIEVNIGEIDKVRPNQLVVFFHDELKIHREHFGKIVIKKKMSYLEVKNDALRFFKDCKKVRFNKRPITVKVVDKLPK